MIIVSVKIPIEMLKNLSRRSEFQLLMGALGIQGRLMALPVPTYHMMRRQEIGKNNSTLSYSKTGKSPGATRIRTTCGTSTRKDTSQSTRTNISINDIIAIIENHLISIVKIIDQSIQFDYSK